jgi:hypothetical protein
MNTEELLFLSQFSKCQTANGAERENSTHWAAIMNFRMAITTNEMPIDTLKNLHAFQKNNRNTNMKIKQERRKNNIENLSCEMTETNTAFENVIHLHEE